jgi:seryl-tRNA synthetase
MGFTSALTYDFELFHRARPVAGNQPVSNFETFQANRLKLRFKDKEKTN